MFSHTSTLRVAVSHLSTRLTHAALLAALVGCSGGGDGPVTPVEPMQQSRSTIVPATSTLVDIRTSQSVSNGQPPGFVFDDFTFTTAASVRTVGWQGGFCRQATNAAAPTPTATTFTVTFYADVAGRPNTGAPLASTTFPIAQAAQTFEKNEAGLACGPWANTVFALYRYSVTLPSTFVASANTKYWISVQAATPTYDVIWGWRGGTSDNATSLQLFSGTYTTLTLDRAFSLAP
jgi:hypothetical protein